MEKKYQKRNRNIMLFRENWMIYVKTIRNCQKKKIYCKVFLIGMIVLCVFLGIETVDTAVQQDIQNEKALEEKRRMEQMPKGSILKDWHGE